MVIFLLKSSACLAIFLMFYKLLLEKERMHTFKRYYLLAALVLALAIPSITFVEYIEVAPAPFSYEIAEALPMKTSTAPLPIDEPSPINWPSVLSGIYILGVLFFMLRFLKNLLTIARNIRNNPKLRIEKLINVLLQNATVPHTFFNYIFLERKKFEANAIPQEVLLHEATHANQKHSLDVLFVEVLQIIFWFNPLIYLTKKSITLNHEFLADQAVLTSGIPTTDYQNTLLSFASSADYKNYQPPMANAINYSSYSSIKKRFKVMKTRTSRKSILFRSLLLLPLLALLLYGFSESRTVEISEKDLILKEQIHTADVIEILINKKGQLFVGNESVALEDLASFLLQFNTTLSKEERETKVRAKIIPFENAPKEIISEIENILVEYGVAQIDIIGAETVLPPVIQNGATQEQISKYNTLAKKYNAQPKAKMVISSEDLKNLELIYRKMSEKQKADAQPFPQCPDSKSNQQEGATKEQMGEYNAMAKEYNTMLDKGGNFRIKKSDLDRLKHLYDIMTEDQQVNAEPFPDFPEPPEPPTPPSPSPPDKSEREVAEEVIQEIIANQDPYDDGLNVVYLKPSSYPKTENFIEINTSNPKQTKPATLQNPEKNTSILNYPYKSVADNEVENDVSIPPAPPAPPAPPKPKAPLDYVIEMAKKDAQFYHKGKEISSDKAIDLMKKNKNLNIDSKTEKGKRPVVKLSTEPFVLEN